MQFLASTGFPLKRFIVIADDTNAALWNSILIALLNTLVVLLFYATLARYGWQPDVMKQIDAFELEMSEIGRLQRRILSLANVNKLG